jgi:hypothetical protein
MSISYRVITINLIVAINCTSGLIKKLISMMGKIPSENPSNGFV